VITEEKIRKIDTFLRKTYPKVIHIVWSKKKQLRIRMTYKRLLWSDREVLIYIDVFTGKRWLRVIPIVMHVMMAIDKDGYRIYNLREHPGKFLIEEILTATAEHIHRTLFGQKNKEKVKQVQAQHWCSIP